MGVINAAEEETVKRPASHTHSARFTADSPLETLEGLPTGLGPALTTAPAAGMPTKLRALYDLLDRYSGGRAAGIMRLASFLIIGGSASVLNLVIIAILDHFLHPSKTDTALYLVISAISTEISLVYNFALNDRFTFRSLIDTRRSWLQRCVRFHGPASVGFVLTLAISATVFTITHHTVRSQAVAIVIVTGVNFLMHRYWTYRTTHTHTQPAH